MVAWWKKRVKGSVLLLSLVISLLIFCLLLFLFPLNSFMYKLYGHFSQNRLVYSNINSALKTYLSSPANPVTSNPSVSPLFGNTTMFTERWGLFELVTIKSQYEAIEKQNTYLVGQSFFDSTDSLVLYQSRINSPIICVGNATIEGRMKLPTQGLKPGYIEGSYFTGSLSLAKAAGQSDIYLPKPGSFFLETQNRVTNPQNIAILNSINPKNLSSLVDSIAVSYSSKPELFFSNESFTIGSKIIEGKVYICSNQSITVEPYSSIKGVIIIAPKVIIKKGVVGNFQVFATDSVAVESNVTLEYPSVIVLSQQKSDKSSTLNIGADSFIDGALIITRPDEIPNYFFPKTVIDKTTRIRGMVYSQGLLDARGTIVGSTFTENFFCQTPSGFYLNYINNGQLLYFDMPYEFALPFIFENKWKKCLVQRLN